MITFKDVNDSFIKLDYTNDSEFESIYNHFSVLKPGIEYTDAYRAGLTDGKKHFINAQGLMLFGLKKRAIEFCIAEKIDFKDETTPIENDFDVNDFIYFMTLLKKELQFTPYEHQLKGAILALQEKRGVYLSFTGSGKSLQVYIIARYFIYKNFKTLILCPRIDLVTQMEQDFTEYFSDKEKLLQEKLDETKDQLEQSAIKIELSKIYSSRKVLGCENIKDFIHKIYGGQEKYTNKLITISTRDSLSINQERVNKEYFEDVKAFIGDEIHKIGARTSADIVSACINSQYKIGVSGSLSNDVIENLTIEGLIGNVTTIIKMREGIELGLATNLIIKPIYLKYSDSIVKDVKKMKYTEEDSFLRNLPSRNKFIAQLSNSFKDKNVLIIFKNKDNAYTLLEDIVKAKQPDINFNIKDYRKQNDLKVYISEGATKSDNRNEFRGYLENSNGNILLATDKVIQEGTNIKNVHVMIFCRVNKKNTGVIQSCGRMVRLHKSKDNAVLYDIVDDLTYYTKSGRGYPNYSFKHWEERLDTYVNEEFEIDEPIAVQLDLNDTLF